MQRAKIHHFLAKKVDSGNQTSFNIVTWGQTFIFHPNLLFTKIFFKNKSFILDKKNNSLAHCASKDTFLSTFEAQNGYK